MTVADLRSNAAPAENWEAPLQSAGKSVETLELRSGATLVLSRFDPGAPRSFSYTEPARNAFWAQQPGWRHQHNDARATLVHFSPPELARLWELLSARLSPVGRAVIEIQCPIAQDMPETRMATAQVGQVVYKGWASAQRIDESRQHWRIRYVAELDGVEIDRQCTDYVCWVASAEQVLAEADACGLAGQATDNLVIQRKAT